MDAAPDNFFAPACSGRHAAPALRGVTAHFQPLVSVKRRAVFGYEALCRGLAPDGSLIPPAALFAGAHSTEELVDLDRVCREAALAAFAPLHRSCRTTLLSLNIESSIIGPHTHRSGRLLAAVRNAGVNPSNVIIEIIESKAGDPDALLDFVSFYRSQGFLIALDDVGAGHSNLDRIPRLRPDILKIDRSLISGVDSHFYKQEVTRFLVQMACRIGALPLAEGVERSDEAVRLMEMGVDVFQGFYFARPAPADREDPDLPLRIRTAAARYKTHTVERLAAEKAQRLHYVGLFRELSEALDCVPTEDFELRLSAFVEARQELECLYILDRHGRQLTETICNPDRLAENKRLIYEPAPKGADHSLKEYVLPLHAGKRMHITSPYISLASGNPCVTISGVVEHAAGQDYILCADIARSHEAGACPAPLSTHDE